MPKIRYLNKTRKRIPSIYSEKSGNILQNMNFSRCYRNGDKAIYGFDPNIKAFYEAYLKPYEENLKCPFWIARYPLSSKMKFSENPSGKYTPVQKPLYGWQYSSKGNVSGISGNVDMNIWYEDLAVTAGDDKDEDTESSFHVASVDSVSKVPTYKKGKTCILQANMNVRAGHGVNYRQKKRSELTLDGRKNAKDGTYAVLKKGTDVTVRSVYKSGNDIWIQIPSGWIAAVYNRKIYVK